MTEENTSVVQAMAPMLRPRSHFSSPLVLALGTALIAWAGSAEAGRSCENRPLTPEVMAKGLNLAARTSKALDAEFQKNGTQVVLEIFRDEELWRLFVMEKGEGWGEEYDEASRTGDWQFQWYWPDRKINLQENTARCMSCHSSQKDRDYLFTARRLPEFRGKPVE